MTVTDEGRPHVEFIFPGEIRVNAPGDYVLFANDGQYVGWRRVDPIERYRKLRDLLRKGDPKTASDVRWERAWKRRNG